MDLYFSMEMWTWGQMHWRTKAAMRWVIPAMAGVVPVQSEMKGRL